MTTSQKRVVVPDFRPRLEYGLADFGGSRKRTIRPKSSASFPTAPDAAGLKFAASKGIATIVLPRSDYASRRGA